MASPDQTLPANSSSSTGSTKRSGSYSRSGSSNGLNGPTLSLDLRAMRSKTSTATLGSYGSSVDGLGSPKHTAQADDGARGSGIIPESVKSISPNGRFKRSITYWQKGELLGCGSFGIVYEGISDEGVFLAVKEVSLLDEGHRGRTSISQLEREIALLSNLEHENIVRYYGSDKDESTLYIFLELVKGSLEKIYRKYPLHDSQVSAYTRQILRGLKYLHDRDVVHRDVKCANILVDANGSAKLADFGLAKAIKDVNSCQGTANWMAPEVVSCSKARYGLPADIWSLGCTVLEMLTRQIPYGHLDWFQALFKIERGKLPKIPNTLSRDAQDFIKQCLQVNPGDRPTANQLLDHPFVKRPLSDSPTSPLSLESLDIQ